MRRVFYVALLTVVAVTIFSINRQPFASLEMSAEAAGVIDEVTPTKPQPTSVTLPRVDYTWIETVTADGTTIKDTHPQSFTMEFVDDQVIITTDCNNGVSSYDADSSGMFDLGLVTMTKRSCADSQENEYMRMLSDIRSYELTEAGVLVFRLRGGATMRFE